MPGFLSKREMALSRMNNEVTQSPLQEYSGLQNAKGWTLKLCWFPKKCFLSGKPLWGKNSYYAQDYWLDKNEFIVWSLKGRK